MAVRVSLGGMCGEGWKYEFRFVDEKDGSVGFEVDAGCGFDDGEAANGDVEFVGEAEAY